MNRGGYIEIPSQSVELFSVDGYWERESHISIGIYAMRGHLCSKR